MIWMVKEAISLSVAELDHLVNQKVQRAIEGHFCSRGYVFERKGLE
jgi:redox-regulated HSP33 family molecular chaperone